MENIFCVYIDCRKDGTVFYVGKGLIKRFNKTIRANRGWISIVKNSKGCHRKMVANRLSNEEACLLEMALINYYDRKSLVNATDGGGTTIGFKPSIETVLKMSIAAKGNKRSLGVKQSKETIQKRVSKMLGRHYHTKESKKAIGNAHRGKTVPSSVRCNHSKFMSGNNYRNIKVVNIVTGKIYPSVKKAAKSIPCAAYYLSSKLNGRRKNNTNLKYLW